MQPEYFPSKIQLRIDARIALNMKSYILVAQPVGVPPAILAIAQWTLSIHLAFGIVKFPEMKQRLALLGQFPVDLFLIESAIELVVFNIPPLLVEKGFDVFVCHLLRQRPAELLSLFEALEEVVDRRPLSLAGILGDGSAAETIVEMQFQHPFVVHMRTPL